MQLLPVSAGDSLCGSQSETGRRHSLGIQRQIVFQVIDIHILAQSEGSVVLYAIQETTFVYS